MISEVCGLLVFIPRKMPMNYKKKLINMLVITTLYLKLIVFTLKKSISQTLHLQYFKTNNEHAMGKPQMFKVKIQLYFLTSFILNIFQ